LTTRHARLLEGLNPQQRAAVCHTEGPVLVLAGAGSGKTRVITTRIAYLIAEGLAQPEDILAVTFTNKAADEMRERVADIVGRELASGIVLSTFHSFCVRVLRAEIGHLGYRRNFTISSESDARTLLRRSLEDMDGVRETFDAGTFLERIGTLKNAGIEPGDEPEPEADEGDTSRKYREWLPVVYERYTSALRAANALDFDDLLLLTLRLWREHTKVLQRYQQQFRYVMVDEYQDTNRVQYELLKALSGEHRNLCVVGDDDQSIYSWRGADIGNVLSLEKDFPELTVIKLEQNYRSTKTILDAANHVIGHNAARRPKNLWSTLGAGRPIDWFVTGDEESEAKEAVSWLQHIQEKTGAHFRHFAVLYRSNIQSRPFEVAFRQAGIPYLVLGGQEFFERAEIKDIVAYLKLVANPHDEAACLRIVNVPRRGIGDVTLHQVHEICRTESCSLAKGLTLLLRQGGLAPNTDIGIRRFLGLIAEFRKRFRERNTPLADLAGELVGRIGYRDELIRTGKSPEQFQARWENVQVLLTAVSDYEANAAEPTLAGFLDESALVSTDDRKSKEQRRQDAVSLMTIHSAKGLEFPFVFIVGVEDGILPHEKSLSDAAIEEERRLFYVALTRAKRHVTLFEALAREKYGKRRLSKTSRFVKEIPENLLQQQIRAAADMVEASVRECEKPKPRKKRRR